MLLSGLINRYSAELEGELAFRGFDIRDMEDPYSSFTIRRLWVLFSALPARNAVSNAISSITREQAAWPIEAYILANVFDAIQALNYITQMANSPRGQKPQKPKQHPRPAGNSAKRIPDRFPGRTIYAE